MIKSCPKIPTLAPLLNDIRRFRSISADRKFGGTQTFSRKSYGYSPFSCLFHLFMIISCMNGVIKFAPWLNSGTSPEHHIWPLDHEPQTCKLFRQYKIHNILRQRYRFWHQSGVVQKLVYWVHSAFPKAYHSLFATSMHHREDNSMCDLHCDSIMVTVVPKLRIESRTPGLKLSVLSNKPPFRSICYWMIELTNTKVYNSLMYIHPSAV